MVTLLDPNGNVLATGTLRAGSEGRILTLSQVTTGKSRLLDYYFGRGHRAVVVHTGVFRLHGVLKTRWLDGCRSWTIEVHSNPGLCRGFVALPEHAESIGPPLADIRPCRVTAAEWNLQPS